MHFIFMNIKSEVQVASVRLAREVACFCKNLY
jgi:hypothetical protein